MRVESILELYFQRGVGAEREGGRTGARLEYGREFVDGGRDRQTRSYSYDIRF